MFGKLIFFLLREKTVNSKSSRRFIKKFLMKTFQKRVRHKTKYPPQAKYVHTCARGTCIQKYIATDKTNI